MIKIASINNIFENKNFISLSKVLLHRYRSRGSLNINKFHFLIFIYTAIGLKKGELVI
jgi:hypothetical protein